MRKNKSLEYYFMLTSVFMIFLSCKNQYNQGNQSSAHANSTIEETQFYNIFNGKNLDGWKGDTKYWRVENGVLIGEVTSETILKNNSFIIYEKEQPEDFELKLKYRISNSGNSGINYRSKIIDSIPFALQGYQSDIDGKNRFTGQNYEEKKRTTLAYQGEQVEIKPMPDSISSDNLRKNIKKNCWQTREVVASLGISETLKSHIKADDWNQVHLIVKGNRMQHYCNGVLLSEVTDMDVVNRTFKGYVGVQVHVGPPMKVEYKDVILKHLK
jgi:hypothetical protein